MSKRTTQNAPKNFEDALCELEQILAEIESGNVGLEESLVKYERGNFLIQHCRGVLNQAEQRIESMGKSEPATDTTTDTTPGDDNDKDDE